MARLREKRRTRRLLYSHATLAALLLLAVGLTWVTWNAYARERLAAQRRGEAARELAALEARKEALAAEIAALEEPLGVERELREKYEVGREGEHALVLVEEEPQDTQGPKVAPKRSFWQRVRDMVR